ncbi:MAG: hypothetical protein OXF23_06465 [Candidatus Dadabacteria bacterium]|nr:hypothetical protein [Candidatus Dadabacteria bacterium]
MNLKMQTHDNLEALRRNMFPGAHPAIDSWEDFPWHSGATSRRSSQMLAIDVFGTLKVRPQVKKDRILERIAKSAGMPVEGPWQIHLEWSDTDNLLNEKTQTQVDATAISDHAILLFECKFKEPGGSCSQVKHGKESAAACNGNYELQTNPNNGIQERCALVGKGIAYWDWIKPVYGLATSNEYQPCPFAGESYQWMRNTVLAAALRKSRGVATRAIAVYPDAPYLPIAKKVQGCLGVPPLRPDDEIMPLSYNRILKIAENIEPAGPWSSLTNWITEKVRDVKP